MGFLEKWFNGKITSDRINEYFRKLGIRKRNNLDRVDMRNISVACIQRHIAPVRSIEQYMVMLNGFVKQGAEQGSQLVVFPEYNFFDLFGMLPGFRFIERIINKKAIKACERPKPDMMENSEEASNSKRSGSSFISFIFKQAARPVEKGLREIFSIMAEKYGIYIYTGSFLLLENGMLYNAGALYGPDGRCIGTQKKLHLTDFEADLKMGCGDNLEVYELPIGRVAFPICMDATYFETFRVARELNTDIVIMPIADMGEYDLLSAMRGIWGRVQESYVYGLKASLNGWIAGMHFTGRAGIYAPLSISPHDDGVIEISIHHEDDFVICASIDIERLREERAKAEYYGDVNPEFEKDYVEKTYGLHP